MVNKRRIVWMFDRDAGGHPFINLGVTTLRDAGFHVLVVDSGPKLVVDSGPKKVRGKDRITPYSRDAAKARAAAGQQWVNDSIKPHLINANLAILTLQKKKYGLEKENNSVDFTKRCEFFVPKFKYYLIAFTMKAWRWAVRQRLLTVDLWLTYIWGLFASARHDADIVVASRPQVLGTAWVLAKLKRARLIYYPFELYGHQAADASRLILLLEKLVLSFGVDQVITQNSYRAKVYQSRGAPKRKIVCVRNFKEFTAPLGSGRLRESLSIAPETRIALYEGVLIPGRCLGNLAKAADYLDDGNILVMMGPAQKAWQLDEALAAEGPIKKGKLIIAPPVPHDELPEYVVDAEAGIIIYDGSYLNNRYCEPGKISDYIFCSLPLAFGRYPSIAPLIEPREIGLSFDEHDPKSIARTLNELLNRGKEAYRPQIEEMKKEVSWSTQRDIFIQAVTGDKTMAATRILPKDQPVSAQKAIQKAPSRKPVDILLLIEHVDRELDIATLIKAKLELADSGLSVRIANFYTEARDLIESVDPKVVVSPFFYGTDDPVLSDYVTTWADKRWVNLAWEQILYGTQQALKRPRDAFTKDRVEHIAWSEWYQDYLLANGVSPYKVNWLGHSLYDLYSEEYRAYFLSREKLASRYGLDPKKRWVFFPENYRWAFMSDTKLQRMSEQGGADLEELRSLKVYCVEALDESAHWLAAAAATGEIEVILRPRPAVNTAQMSERVGKAIGTFPRNFHVIKQESVREWLLASDIIVSSNSTSLIEGAVTGKPIYLSAPVKMPECLNYEWCALVPEIRDRDEFVRIARDGGDMSGSLRVRDWVERSFKLGHAPIDQVADRLREIANMPTPQVSRIIPKAGGASPLWLRPVASIMGLELRHLLRSKFQPDYFFNLTTHEKDLFDEREVARRTRAWKIILRRQGSAKVDKAFQQAP